MSPAVPLSLLLAVTIGVSARPACADQPMGDAVVSFSAPADHGCPDEAAFVRGVTALVHEQAMKPAPTRTRIHVRVAPSGDGFEGRLTSEAAGGASSERTLRGASCREVSEGLALVLALAIDPLADPSAKVALDSPPSPPPASSPEPVHPTQAPVAVRQVAVAGSTPALFVAPAVGARLLTGVTPLLDWSFFGSISLGASLPPRPSVRIDVAVGMPARANAGGGSVDFRTLEARVLLCPAAWTRQRIELGVCAGGGLTSVTTSASGYTEDESTQASIWHLGALGRLRVALTRSLGLGVEPELRWLLSSYAWQIQGLQAIGSSARIAGGVGIVADWRIP